MLITKIFIKVKKVVKNQTNIEIKSLQNLKIDI